MYEKSEFNGTYSIRLHSCEDEEPPERNIASVKELGKIYCKLDVQYSDLPDFHSRTGRMTKVLNYEIESVPSGASVEFILYIGGRKQGGESVVISY